tara:strand:- start:20277 stop:20510 length:234 start_codon:yes stop_codon:yes gene_type:complete
MTWDYYDDGKILKDEKATAREMYPSVSRKFMEADNPESQKFFHEHLQMLERKMGVQVTPTIERRKGSLEQFNFWRNA